MAGRAAPALAALREEYARALGEAAAAATVLGGESDEMMPWADLFVQLELCTEPLILRTRVASNLIRWRPNYARALLVWLFVVTIRHPLKTLLLVLVLAAWFHAIMVRRGVVHLVPPQALVSAVPSLAGRQQTLMGAQLLTALAAATVLMLLVFGCFWHTVAILLVPVAIIAAHSALRRPVNPSETLELAADLRHRLLRALHGKHAESEEMESGGVDEPPIKDAEMAKRVEQIRQKYRPPTSRQALD